MNENDGRNMMPVSTKDNAKLSLNEISPEELTKGQTEMFARDIKRLIRSKNKFVKVNCPACGLNKPKKAFMKYQLKYAECAACGTIYINPRPSPEILADYYANSENYWYWNKYIFPASEKVRREKIFRPRVRKMIEICRRYGLSRDVLLEVGAGFGIFCEEVIKTKLFRRVIGVEPTPDLAETCRRKGIEVIEKPIEKVKLDDGGVNIITAFEVIEHLFSPKDFIKKCHSLLSKKGVLILSCPNGQGFDISVLREMSEAVDVEHLNYFNVDSLSGLMKKVGFRVLEASTPGKLDAELVRLKILAGEYDPGRFPFLKQLLIDKWESAGQAFQHFLAENNLSSHMWVVAQKNE